MSEIENSLRDKILDTSRILLLKEGHSALSMRKIAGKIGVSATSIYIYFDNKDHLMHTLIEEAVEDLSRYIEQRASEVAGRIEKFKAIINAYMDFAMSNPEKYQIIYLIQPNAMSRYPREKFRKARRCYELLVKVIEECVAKGLMQVENSVIAAYSIWAQLHGIVSVVLNQRLDSRINKNQFLEESVEQVIQGFLIRSTVS